MNKFVVPNALADVVLLVGVDDNVGLIPVDAGDVSVYNALFELKYEAQVLSAISGTDMVNFHPFAHRVDSYPPNNTRETFEHQAEEMVKARERMMSDFSLGSKKSFQNTESSPKKTTRSISVSPKMLLARSMSMTIKRPRLGGNTVNIVPELPISDEVINSISTFCFPDGFKIFRTKPPPYTHAFVLTNLHGQKFASCLTFNLAAVVTKDDQGNAYINLDLAEQEHSDDDKMRCYIPQCFVIISKFPYYTTMKECLSSMLSYIEKDPEEMTTFLKEYANVITHTPVPPAGNLAVNFRLYNLNVTLMPPTHPDKPVIDLQLHLTFLCFNAEEFLRILSCVLVEERIVFLSSNYALLTLIMESVMNLVLPFKWRFTYSTILPSSALGYLESPGTFMYGVHSRHKEEVEQVEGLILVDIDEGTVFIPEQDCQATHVKQNGYPPTSSVPNLPSEMATVFKNKWSHLKLQFDLLDTIRPFSYNIEQMREDRKKKVLAQNKYITDTCLELMVNLFRDVVYKLRFDHNHFDKWKFLKEHATDRDFYQRVFLTDMFKVFLEERMKEKTDYWSDLEMKSRGFGHSSLRSSLNSSAYSNRPRRYTLSQIVPSDKRGTTVLCLKDITDLKIHVKNTILQITKAMEHSDDYDDNTSLQYLRALFYCADNDNMAAMQDFIDLSITNIRILPAKVLSDLYNRLTEEENTKFKNLRGHEVILDCIEDTKGREGERQRIRMDPVEIPDSDLNYIKFEEIVSLKQMSNDYRTIQLLFEALTQEKMTSTSVIEQMTFQIFACCWEDNQIQCSQVKLGENILLEEETILKVSTLIKTDFGLGRIGLTDKRLFFLSDVSNQYKEIVKLREIRDLEQSEYSSLFSRVQTLKIHRKGKGTSPFTAFLKEERNWWYMVIREMWAGKVVAEAMKDVMMVQHAIQNTLLIDAIIASGQENCTTHSQNTEAAAEKLSHFYCLYREGKHLLPHDTQDTLQRKIDVNIGERESKTVHTLLYTGGDEHISPRLWCGLSDGRIKVFNAVTWTLESEIIVELKRCVACLTAVDDNHVWAGAFGIYILDARTLTCTKTLLEHTDLVVDIVLHDNNRFVYTASLDGTIIKWNAQKLSRAKEKIILKSLPSLRSLKVYKDRLICGSWESIVICDLEGSVLNTLKVKENETVVAIDSFTVSGNGEVWTGTRRGGKIYILDISTGELKHMITIDKCKGISSMEEVDGRIWTGTKDGMIYIYDINNRRLWKELQGHDDAVRVLCDIRDRAHVGYSYVRYMISGGGSMDGRVCIWNATAERLLDSSDEHTLEKIVYEREKNRSSRTAHKK
ncbi:DENN domain-containing protein 3-like isoform X2 [Mercenaria mercenaria]|uniref:DENN domain-containing protein 3-like isoform X2 n=1 Tax=Mercenaria mercenaria TaxID=6596 RepID=UPI00234E4FB9|nr:DENN domain-containing protein 3-like isoform X2 [Mercenaria mercenaria]